MKWEGVSVLSMGATYMTKESLAKTRSMSRSGRTDHSNPFKFAVFSSKWPPSPGVLTFTYRPNTIGQWFLGCKTARDASKSFGKVWIALMSQTLRWKVMLNTSYPTLKKLFKQRDPQRRPGSEFTSYHRGRNTHKDQMTCLKPIVFDFLLTAILTFSARRRLLGLS